MAVLYMLDNYTNRTVSQDEFSRLPDWPISSIDSVIPNNVSYTHHWDMLDSIQAIRYLKNGEAFSIIGVQFVPVIGTSWGLYCDTCSLKWYHDHGPADEAHKQYYINLPGWGINNSEYSNGYTEFYVNKGQSYIRKHDIESPVKFRFNHQHNFLMIPVTKTAKTVAGYFACTLSVIFIFYFLYLIACFINFLLDLSKGMAFTNGNLRRLLTLAITCFAAPIIAFLLCLLMKIIFYSYFTNDVVMNKSVWEGSWKSIGIGLIFLLLYKAFRQGKQLKEEQDLTI